MIEARLTRLVTRDRLLWSKWDAIEVATAIAGRSPIALSDGGYVHPDYVTLFYPSEVWEAIEAAAEARRQKNRQEEREAEAARPPKRKRFRWFA